MPDPVQPLEYKTGLFLASQEANQLSSIKAVHVNALTYMLHMKPAE